MKIEKCVAIKDLSHCLECACKCNELEHNYPHDHIRTRMISKIYKIINICDDLILCCFFFFAYPVSPNSHLVYINWYVQFFLLLRYHIIFYTNELSKKVIDFPSIYTRRIGFFSKIEIFELNKKNHQQQQQKTNKNQKTTTIL